MNVATTEPQKAPNISELVQQERSLQKELNALRKKLARLVSSAPPDNSPLHPLERDLSYNDEEKDEVDTDLTSRYAFTAPIETDSPLPSILLRPLSLQDPLRSKWNLGLGLISDKELQQAAPPPSIPTSAELPKAATDLGYMRIFGLLPSGAPCQHKLTLSSIARKGKVVIGRDPTLAQIVIPEIGVSRAHAILEYINDQLVITDNQSTNGLLLNGNQISPYKKRTALYDGCVINLGETRLRVEINR